MEKNNSGIHKGLKKTVYKCIIEVLTHLPFSDYTVRYWSNFLFTRKIRKQYTDMNNPSQEAKLIIYMADGKTNHGGFADRLRGIVSTYKICRDLNFDFRIYFINPVNLDYYLLPNDYNWKITQGEICYNKRHVKLCYIASMIDDYHNDHNAEIHIASSVFKKHKHQIHVYTNMSICNNEYGSLYHELFKPSDELQLLIDSHLQKIGEDYFSITFRFQQLLGDFNEGNFTILRKTEQNELICKCIEHIKNIYAENSCYKKVLITSDSSTFLYAASKINYVYSVSGKREHIDYSTNTDKQIYLNSFLDYYLLTYSKKIYLVIDNAMYESGFPLTAALHNNIPYIIKKYNDEMSYKNEYKYRHYN